MKKLTAVLVGAGNRGQIYADYSINNNDELTIIAAVDPNPLRLKECGDKYGVPENMLFRDLKSFIAAKIPGDFVINATMDEEHY